MPQTSTSPQPDLIYSRFKSRYSKPAYRCVIEVMSNGEIWSIKNVLSVLRRNKPELRYDAVRKRLERLSDDKIAIRVSRGEYILNSLVLEVLGSGGRVGGPAGGRQESARFPEDLLVPRKEEESGKKKMVKLRIGLSYAFFHVKKCRSAQRSLSIPLDENSSLEVKVHKNRAASIVLRSTDNPLDCIQFEKLLTAISTLKSILGFSEEDIVVKQYEITYDFEKRMISGDFSFQAWTSDIMVRVYAHKPGETRAELRMQRTKVPYEQATSFIQTILEGGASMLHLYQAVYLDLRNQNALTPLFVQLSNLIVALINRIDNLSAQMNKLSYALMNKIEDQKRRKRVQHT
ncbi:MAG: hypothetical protein DSO07_00615 [Thermoproteota archaeon]|uniref:Uncharacterized protein n=1 Tax=Candidatus Methanodesulfokora washburnensis TaxID=2478471 RepID=A0A429GHE6_9CREN|nr:hypothetical protein [Candidatus Methanodesulfokores washburnensis]RSN73205.1 hypothetical protein D6D85_11140 [Candidatus Methanodesulfokores washburnensis]TDA42191.1 MAG: hypothetical protein DSO07_00615 [Candidatus Korarchaeota archaeon]